VTAVDHRTVLRDGKAVNIDTLDEDVSAWEDFFC
jgi:hypothetical protein